MANLKRQSQAVDCVEGSPELAATARHYSEMARRHMDVSFEDRMGLATKDVRYKNNFTKACALDICARAIVQAAMKSTGPRPAPCLRVADVACGRGQDATKVKYAAQAANTKVAAYFALDLSAENIVSANIIADQYLADVHTRVDVRVGDMCCPDAYAFIPDGSVNLVTCQLALHYLFKDPGCLDTFFREVSRVLQPGGLVMVSYTDGRAVVRRARNLLPADVEAEPDATVHHRSKFYHFSIPARSVARAVPSPFGLQYMFSLPGCVEDVPEYLVHEGVMCGSAARAGLCTGPSLPFHEAAAFFIRMPRFQEVARKMKCDLEGFKCPDVQDVASLYRFNILAKSKDVLAEWSACMVK
jgi:SAM-dependent methyltransferase